MFKIMSSRAGSLQHQVHKSSTVYCHGFRVRYGPVVCNYNLEGEKLHNSPMIGSHSWNTNMWHILSKWDYSGSLIKNELSTQFENIHLPLHNDGYFFPLKIWCLGKKKTTTTTTDQPTHPVFSPLQQTYIFFRLNDLHFVCLLLDELTQPSLYQIDWNTAQIQ